MHSNVLHQWSNAFNVLKVIRVQTPQEYLMVVNNLHIIFLLNVILLKPLWVFAFQFPTRKRIKRKKNKFTQSNNMRRSTENRAKSTMGIQNYTQLKFYIIFNVEMQSKLSFIISHCVLYLTQQK